MCSSSGPDWKVNWPNVPKNLKVKDVSIGAYGIVWWGWLTVKSSVGGLKTTLMESRHKHQQISERQLLSSLVFSKECVHSLSQERFDVGVAISLILGAIWWLLLLLADSGESLTVVDGWYVASHHLRTWWVENQGSWFSRFPRIPRSASTINSFRLASLGSWVKRWLHVSGLSRWVLPFLWFWKVGPFAVPEAVSAKHGSQLRWHPWAAEDWLQRWFLVEWLDSVHPPNGGQFVATHCLDQSCFSHAGCGKGSEQWGLN